jgi:hypothetical protein
MMRNGPYHDEWVKGPFGRLGESIAHQSFVRSRSSFFMQSPFLVAKLLLELLNNSLYELPYSAGMFICTFLTLFLKLS